MRGPSLVEVWLVGVASDAALDATDLPEGVSADAVTLVASGVSEASRVAVVPVAMATSISVQLRARGATVEIRRASRGVRPTVELLDLDESPDEADPVGIVDRARGRLVAGAKVLAAAVALLAIVIGPLALIFWLTGGGDAGASQDANDAETTAAAAPAPDAPDPSANAAPGAAPDPPPELDMPGTAAGASGGTQAAQPLDDGASSAGDPTAVDGAAAPPPEVREPAAPDPNAGDSRDDTRRLVVGFVVGLLLGFALLAALQRRAPVPRRRDTMRRTAVAQLGAAMACLAGVIAIAWLAARPSPPPDPAVDLAPTSLTAGDAIPTGTTTDGATTPGGADEASTTSEGSADPGGADPSSADPAAEAAPASIVAFVDALPATDEVSLASVHDALVATGPAATGAPGTSEASMSGFVAALPAPCPTSPAMARIACRLEERAVSAGVPEGTATMGDDGASDRADAAIDAATGTPDDTAEPPASDPAGAAGRDATERADDNAGDNAGADEDDAPSPPTAGPDEDAEPARAGDAASAQDGDANGGANEAAGGPAPPDVDPAGARPDATSEPPRNEASNGANPNAEDSDPADPQAPPGLDGDAAAPPETGSRTPSTPTQPPRPTPLLAFGLGMLLGGALGFSGRALLALTPREEDET